MAKNDTASRTQIIVAIIAFFATIGAAVISTKFWEPDSGPTSPPISTPPRTNPPPSPQVPSAPLQEETPGAHASAPEILWHREVTFPINTGLDLADGEPRVRPEAEAREFVITAGSFAGNLVPVFYHQGRVGKVEKRVVAVSDCRDALIPQQGSVYSRINQTVCFESQDGTRLAAVSVLGWNSNSWATDVQVWRLKN